MNFQEAVIFISAVIVIVSAGIVLGAALRGRTIRQSEKQGAAQLRKSELYSEIIGALDSIAIDNDQKKQWFIHRYYQALVIAPDEVVHAINRYLDGVTAIGADLSPDKMMELRGKAVMAMRNDLQNYFGNKTKLPLPELYKIEVRQPEVDASTSKSKSSAIGSDSKTPKPIA